jgi:hypothetical protein
MKIFLVGVSVIVLALGGLRLFALAVDTRKPVTAQQVFTEMSADMIRTTNIVKSPNADKIRAMGSNLTQHIWRPPEATPTPAPPRPRKITLGFWLFDWFFGGGPNPDTGYSK